MIYSHLVRLGFIVRRTPNSQCNISTEQHFSFTNRLEIVDNESLIKRSEHGQEKFFD